MQDSHDALVDTITGHVGHVYYMALVILFEWEGPSSRRVYIIDAGSTLISLV